VFAQTWSDWELIVADDGSQANTREYLQSLESEPRVRVLYLEHCGRPAIVRNAALRAARAELVAFLDSDDLWLPEKLQRQIASLRRHPACRWSYTRFVLVDESGSTPTAWARRTGGWPALGGWILDRLLKTETAIALPTVLAQRSLLEEIGGFDESLIGSEDYSLYLRLAARSEVAALDESLALVRRHGQHFSGQGLVPYEANLRIIEQLLSSGTVEHLRPILRKKRAHVAAGLARAHVMQDDRIGALRSLVGSVRYSWQYPLWWAGAMQATARALVPEALIRARRRRHQRVADCENPVAHEPIPSLPSGVDPDADL
jgi:glycosyltransferase involved in cell wall biosynthesis